MRHVCVLMLACFAIPVLAQQETPRGEAFIGYSYLNADTNGLTTRQGFNGWEAAGSANSDRWFALEADGAGYYKRYSIPLTGVVNPLSGPVTLTASVTDYSFLGGPRFNYKPVFIHALFGVDRLTGSAFGFSASQNSFAGVIGGGIEEPIARHLAVRASADYAFTRHNIFGGPAVTQNNFRVAVGVVLTFGHTGETVAAPPTQHQHPMTGLPGRGTGMQIASLGLFVVPLAENTGARITDVATNGAAALAGLHPDDLINSVNGTQVKTPVELAAALSGIAPGSSVRLGYMIRGQWQSETTVIIGGH
jgi:Outer membrane protein beta-barrel domain/PDZ domain